MNVESMNERAELKTYLDYILYLGLYCTSVTQFQQIPNSHWRLFVSHTMSVQNIEAFMLTWLASDFTEVREI